MGGKSESSNEVVAFIHASDAEGWAVFLQNKLKGNDYKIESYLHDPSQSYIPKLFCSTQTCVVLVSPSLLEQTYFSFWKNCVTRFHHRTLFLFLGVDTTDLQSSLGIPLSNRVLAHHWLEVDGSKEAVTCALIKLIELFELADLSHLQNISAHQEFTGDCTEGGRDDLDEDCSYSEISSCDMYDFPPPPRQQNSIVRVMPSVLYEHDSHEVLILLERKAEGKLVMVTETGCGPSYHITMEHLASSAYIATLPSDFVGEVRFLVLSGEHCLGRSSLHVNSCMDQLSTLLKEEMNPLTLLCSAMGLPGQSSRVEELDSLLAKQLATSQFPSGLENILGDLNTTEQGSSQWPTLLHFAAEFNLTKVCEELLRCPGMIHAACRENCDGLYPCQLAEKNGFQDLGKRLVQYVEDIKSSRRDQDSGILIPENLPAPSAHVPSSHSYVNELSHRPVSEDVFGSDDSDYVQMSSPGFPCQAKHRESLSSCQSRVKFKDLEDHAQDLPPPPAPCHKEKNDGYAKPRSHSEGCVITPYMKTPLDESIAEEEDGSDNDPPPLKPKVGRSQSSACTFPSNLSISSANSQSDSDSSRDSANLDVEQGERLSKTSTETLTNLESGVAVESDPVSDDPTSGATLPLEDQAEARPLSQTSSSSSQSDYEVFQKHQASISTDSPVLRSKNTKRSKSVQDKISRFFKKIKPGSRLGSSISETDLCHKEQKKQTVYTRQSTMSTNSDPGHSSLTMRRSNVSSGGSESERDSGAVCDDPDTSVELRSKEKYTTASRNTGKRNGVSMQRRVSVRIQKAKNEDLSERPTLPSRRSSVPKETFRSFLKETENA